MKMKKFTLIELLVVVAIIGILASILLPSLQRARKAAKFSVCLSQNKQIHYAFVMFGDTNNDFYPISDSTTAFDTRIGVFLGQDTNPTTSNKLWICPEDVPVRNNGHFSKSYVGNSDEIWQAGTKAGFDYGVIGRIAGTSRTFAEVDSTTNLMFETHIDNGEQNFYGYSTYERNWWDRNLIKTGHLKNRISHLATDGSAKGVPFTNVPMNSFELMKAVK